MNITNCGYFSRKLNLLTIDTQLNPERNSDCGTKRYLKYHIDDKESLLRIEGTYYKSRPTSIFEQCVKFDDDFLIGKDIYMRSPIFCKDERICSKCYGKLANNNRNVNIGVIGSTIISSRFTQNNLSAKHSLQTDSQSIELSDNYDKYFTLDGNQLLLDKNDIKNYKDLCLTIYRKDLDIETDTVDLADMDDKEAIKNEERLTCSRIYITTYDPFDIKFELKEVKGIQLNVSDYLISLIERHTRGKKVSCIPLKIIDEEESLGTFDVTNHELNKTLIETKNLLEKEDHAGCYNDIEKMIYRFNRLLIEGKIYSHLVHTQIICRNLIRSQRNILKRPDFEKNEPYTILTVQRALMNHPSLFISLSYERVKEQFRNVLTFRKNKSSIIDKLFMLKYNQEYELDIENKRNDEE